jgi:hypothetical protein
MPLLLCGFFDGRSGRNLLVRGAEAASQQSASLLQLSNLVINLNQNL